MRIDLVELVEAAAEHLDLQILLVSSSGGLVQPSRHVGVSRPQLVVVMQRRGHLLSSSSVEHEELVGGIGESDLLGLAMDGDGLGGQRTELAGRHPCSTQYGPGAPRRQHLTVADDLAVLALPADLGDVSCHLLVTGHDGLHDSTIRAVAHQTGVGLLPEQQPQGAHDHRLSGTGLTGDGGE